MYQVLIKKFIFFFIFPIKEAFEKVIKVSKAYKDNSEWFEKLWKVNVDGIYDLGKRRRELGIAEKVIFFS